MVTGKHKNWVSKSGVENDLNLILRNVTLPNCNIHHHDIPKSVRWTM